MSSLNSLLIGILPRLKATLTAEIARDIDVYRRVGEQHGAVSDLTSAVDVAARSFYKYVAMAPTEDAADIPDSSAFRRLGRLEARSGRSHETLQRAYRVATRHVVAWFANMRERGAITRSQEQALTSHALTFINAMASMSAEGHARYGDDDQGVSVVRDRLWRLLVQEDGSPSLVRQLALEAQWTVPNRFATLAFGPDTALTTSMLETFRPLGPEILEGVSSGRVIALVDAELDLTELRARLPDRIVIYVGPAVPRSLISMATRIAMRASRAPAVSNESVVYCDDHVLQYMGSAADDVVRVLAASRLAALDDLTASRRLILGRVLQAWLELGTLNADVPGVLDKSRHTLRYQRRQLEEIFGDALTDRDRRVELMLALRWQIPQWQEQLDADAE